MTPVKAPVARRSQAAGVLSFRQRGLRLPHQFPQTTMQIEIHKTVVARPAVRGAAAPPTSRAPSRTGSRRRWSIRSRQGHYAVRRPPLDGDGVGMIGTKARVQRRHALRYAADGWSRLSLLKFPADQRYCRPARRAPASIGAARADRARRRRLGRASSYCLIGSHPKDDTSFWDKLTKGRRRWDEMLDKQADLARSKDRHPQAVARGV